MGEAGIQLERVDEYAVEAHDPTGDLIWRLSCDPDTPKPYIHPLTTMAGHVLTDLEPADHPWHRGLWFAIKFINGENFWEEEEGHAFGRQQVSRVPELSSEGGWETVAYRCDWVRPDGGGVMLQDERRIATRVLDERRYLIDWDSHLSADQVLLLDRTPFAARAPRDPEEWPGGPPFPRWGGYGGLMLRSSPDLEDPEFVREDAPRTTEPPTGQRSRWCGILGGVAGSRAGVVMMEHPDNPVRPTPWYGGSNGKSLNAAFLFHEPMVLTPDKPLRLRYRLCVIDGDLEPAELAKLIASSTDDWKDHN